MSAADILQMIETVSPDDTSKLDEIDLRFWLRYAAPSKYRWQISHVLSSPDWPLVREQYNIPYYTRSRDALKAIRPEGWSISIQSFAEFSRCSITFEMRPHVADCNYVCETAPNEELAELHAIIQAWDYERNQK